MRSAAAAPPKVDKTISLVSVHFDPAKPEISVHGNAWLGALLLATGLLAVISRRRLLPRLRSLDIAETEIGIGTGKIRLRPNDVDRQVAYQIWVELSTRKIGLPLDPENDVIIEIYNSWYDFFGVTRELIKSVPVSRVTDDSTRKIINLSIEVLNEGLRPHLTRWHARYRGWYEQELKKSTTEYAPPQEIQKRFPQHAEITSALQSVNEHLINYRSTMQRLVYET